MMSSESVEYEDEDFAQFNAPSVAAISPPPLLAPPPPVATSVARPVVDDITLGADEDNNAPKAADEPSIVEPRRERSNTEDRLVTRMLEAVDAGDWFIKLSIF